MDWETLARLTPFSLVEKRALTKGVQEKWMVLYVRSDVICSIWLLAARTSNQTSDPTDRSPGQT